MTAYAILLLLNLQLSYSAKILIYNPAFGHSHTKFFGRIGDLLVQNGHQVTELVPIILAHDYKKSSKLTKIIEIPEHPRQKIMSERMQRGEGSMGSMWKENEKANLDEMGKELIQMFYSGCQQILDNPHLWMHLKDEKYDIAISEAFDFCGFGIFHILGLKTYITASSSILTDLLAVLIGVPTVPSYVPGLMAAESEEMSFPQRAFNAFGSIMGQRFFLNIMRNQTELFRQKVDAGFPDIGELIADNSALVFTNSVPYLDFPHPTLHKVQEIGGIGIPTVKPLEKEWEEILNRRSKTVYISFGSVAKSSMMPPALKKSVIETARRLPDVQFIWKYEADDLSNIPSNLYLSKWTPQTDLLAHPRLTLFVTHGGLGSVTEIAYSGVPALCVPLFGDQPRNGRMLKRQGVAELLSKQGFADPDQLSQMIEKFLNGDSYKQNAIKLADLLHNVPFKPEEILIRNVDFLARAGHLKQLDPYGRKLSFAQYFLLDVIAVAAVILIVILCLIFVLVKKLLHLLRSSKTKKKNL